MENSFLNMQLMNIQNIKEIFGFKDCYGSRDIQKVLTLL